MGRACPPTGPLRELRTGRLVGARCSNARESSRTELSEGAAAADEIEALLRRAKATIERYGHALLTPFLSEESAHFARLLGDEEGCERHFREAHRLYTEMGAVGHAERVGRERSPKA